MPPDAPPLNSLDLREWPYQSRIHAGPEPCGYSGPSRALIITGTQLFIPPPILAEIVLQLEAGNSVVVRATDEVVLATASIVALKWMGGGHV
jgi:hypothetical protein